VLSPAPIRHDGAYGEHEPAQNDCRQPRGHHDAEREHACDQQKIQARESSDCRHSEPFGHRQLGLQICAKLSLGELQLLFRQKRRPVHDLGDERPTG
jgi:hypothetical protein